MAGALEVHGVKQNPIPLGMVGEERKIIPINETLTRLMRNPSIQKQFNQVGTCKECVWLHPDVAPRRLNGAGYCLYHEWRRRELGGIF